MSLCRAKRTKHGKIENRARWFKYNFNTITLVVRSNMETEELVTIPISRLRRLEELESLESNISNIIAKAKADRDKEKLALLRARQEADPVGHAKKMLEKYHNNKEEINARRRESYRLKKEAEATNQRQPVSPGDSF